MARVDHTESRPYVAWGIFRDMVRSFDDHQLETVLQIVEREQRRRQIDRHQLTLWGAQATREATS